MFELILPDRPVVNGERFPVRVRWEGAEQFEKITVRFGWSAGGERHRTVRTVAEEIARWPGPTGDETFEFTMPPAPYAFEGEGFSEPLSLRYIVEAAARPGKLRRSETLPSRPPGGAPLVIAKPEFPPELQLPFLLKFALKHG